MSASLVPRNRAGLLYALFYAGQFVLLGVQLPFFAGWLTLKGFTAPEIGLITGVALLARLAFGPMLAYWADHQSDERRALTLVSGLFALGAAGLVLAPGKIAIAASALLVLWTFGLLVPLTDAAVLRADRNGWLHYGRTRAWGSASFLLTNLAGGAFFAAAGVEKAAPVMALAAAFAFAASFFLPHRAGDRGGVRPISWREAPRLIRHRVFLLVLISAGLTQGAHAVYYAFSYLRWSEIGYSDFTIGALWAIGVTAEIGMLISARSIALRRSPTFLLALAGAAASARWLLTAAEPPLAVLFLAQMMHALTFAAAYLGAIEFIDRAAPARLANTAMTLMSTTGVGALTGAATVAAGYIWQGAGPASAYAAMAAMGACAFALALIARTQWDGGRLFE